MVLPSGIDSLAPSVLNLPFLSRIRIVPLTLPATTDLPCSGCGRLDRRRRLVAVSPSGGGGGALTVNVIAGLVPTLPASSDCEATSV